MKGEWSAPGRRPPEDDLLPFKLIVGISRVTTMADGSYRIWLDIGENDTPAAAKLLALRRDTVEVEFQRRITSGRDE